jgi:hypothetical protein
MNGNNTLLVTLTVEQMQSLIKEGVKEVLRDIEPQVKEVEEYLTPAEFAEVLKISLVTLWSWDKKKITHPLHIGNQKRYRRSDLEKIMQ